MYACDFFAVETLGAFGAVRRVAWYPETRSAYDTAAIRVEAMTLIARSFDGSSWHLHVEMRSLHFVIALVAGWLQREQGTIIAYLQEENKVLREQLGGKRIRFTDAQRRRLARKGKLVGRRGLRDLGCIMAPDTILRWYRQLVEAKYDGSMRRGPGRPRTAEVLRALVVSMAVANLL